MFFKIKLPCGQLVKVAMNDFVEKKRLATRFRGKTVAKSCNFSMWENPDEVFAEKFVRREILVLCERLFFENEAEITESICIECPTIIGWDATAPVENYNQDDLEHFDMPNGKSCALRVKTDRVHLRAPRTKMLTIICEFVRREGKLPRLNIVSMYPGVDIGDLEGNITEREKRVLFDFDHPGEE